MSKKTKSIDPVREFPKVQKMVYQAAWAASNKRFPIEEALTEAYWAFMECCRTYDPTAGMLFSSWVYFKIHRHLKSHIKNRIKDANRLVLMEINDDICGGAPIRRTLEEALGMRSDLSGDEKQLLQLILDPPPGISTLKFDWEEMREITPKEFIKRIKTHLGFERGVDGTYVDITLFELKQKLDQKQFSMS